MELATEAGTPLTLRENIQSLTQRNTPLLERVDIAIVSSGHHEFGVLISQVHSILPPLRRVLKPAPSLENWPETTFADQIIVYGTFFLPVIELARKMDLPPVEPLEFAKVLLIQIEKGILGVAVDSVQEIRSFSLDELRPLPPWVRRQSINGMIWAMALYDEGIILPLLDMVRILSTQEEEILQQLHPSQNTPAGDGKKKKGSTGPLPSLPAEGEKPLISPLLGNFREEVDSHLLKLSKSLINLEKDPHNVPLLKSVTGNARSIKDSAMMLGFSDLGDVAYEMESVMSQLQEGYLEMGPHISDILFEGTDVITNLLEARMRNEKSNLDTEDFKTRLRKISGRT